MISRIFKQALLTLGALCLTASLASARKPDCDALAKGGDIGWLAQMEADGIKFYDDYGVERDCLEILKENGMDTLRLRVWVDPSDDPTTGHCGKDEVVAMAIRGHKLGLRIMVDFHYSDSWADPGKQFKPAAWENYSFKELQKAVYDHTYDVVHTLVQNGVTPEWVQVGNEIRNGMLWPEGSTKKFTQLTKLINQGYDAVKDVDTDIKVIVHLDHGQDNKVFRWFFDNFKSNRGKCDVIGLSYYPHWIGSDYTETIEDLAYNLDDMAKRYRKEVMVVEVGGHFQKGPNTYEILAAVIKKVRAVPNGRGTGVIYWEPQGTKSFSKGYELGCWNESGTPNVALSAFLEACGPEIENGTYRLKNRASGQMLDNLGATEDGSEVAQWEAGDSDNQKWLVSYSDGAYRLNCHTGGKYLNSLGHAEEGSSVGQAENGGGRAQQWKLLPTDSGYYKIINLENGKALTSASNENGAVQTFAEPGSDKSQQWRFVKP